MEFKLRPLPDGSVAVHDPDTGIGVGIGVEVGPGVGVGPGAGVGVAVATIVGCGVSGRLGGGRIKNESVTRITECIDR